MARALLQTDRKIVALDEASSSLDMLSDSEMQRALRKAFGPQITLICVAHRIKTVIDYDHISKRF